MTTPEQAKQFLESIVQISEEFDSRIAERHNEGAEKYGPYKFMTVDTIEEALQEILDFANYARYTYIQLRMLQLGIAKMIAEPELPSGVFIPVADLTTVRGGE